MGFWKQQLCSEYWWQPVQSDVMAGGQAQGATDSAGQIAHRLLSHEQLLLDQLRMGHEGAPGFGKAHVASYSVE